MHKSFQKGFTLLELLIVIGILAVMAVIAVLVINPIEYLRQSRDTKRIVDLRQLDKALRFVEADQPTANFGSTSTVYLSLLDSASSTCGSYTLPALPSGIQYHCATSSDAIQKIDGTGWLPVDFTQLSAGSPFATLPLDPQNNGPYRYEYTPGGSWALSTALESDRYTRQVAATDGGYLPNRFEVFSSSSSLARLSGVIAYYPLDDIIGTSTPDLSPNADDGGLRNQAAFVVGPGKTGNAFLFNGATSYFVSATTTPYANISSNFTMEFWASPSATRNVTGESTSGASGVSGQRYAIFPFWGTMWGAGHAGAGVSVGTNGVCVFEHADSYLPCLLEYNTPISGWTHIAVSYVNNRPRLYLNGKLVRVGPYTSPRTVHPSGGAVGASDGATSYGVYSGWLDEIRVYNRVLTDSDIAAIYAATK